MAYKNLGSGVSQNPQAVTAGGGSYTGDEHSYESVVFQQDTGVTDVELNLLQEVLGQNGTRLLASRNFPSCFLTGDFLERSDLTGSYTFLTPDPPTAANANKFKLRAADLLVNGWNLRFEYTASITAGENLLSLPTPPVGGIRTDLVILEVWRGLLAPTPSTTNKSPTAKILRNGNAKAADSAPPGNINLADDILDPVLLQETTKRIQIQYRYRVVTGIDLVTYPDGLDTPTLVANTTPYLGGSSVDGNATAYVYTKSSTDSGLWVAGTGDAAAASTLGTVDGLMYAVPICAVFRRNSSPFDRSANINGGGLMASSTSGRPDGLYSDQIVADDVRDLRKTIAYSYEEILDKSVQFVLDNSLTANNETYGGTGGTSVFVKDNIVGGSKLGTSDSVRINFSDRFSSQSVVAKTTVAGPSSTVVFDLASFPIPYSGAVNLPLLNPGVKIGSITKVRLVFGTTDKDAFVTPGTVVSSIVYNAGSTTATITFSAPITATDVYVEFILDYPSGLGLTRNLVSISNVWTPPAASIAAWALPGAFTATSDVTRYSLSSSYWWSDIGHREVSIRLPSITQTPTKYVAEISGADSVLYVDDVVDPTSVSIAGKVITSVSYNTAYTRITYTPSDIVGTAKSVSYTALRPLPPVAGAPGDSYQIWYQSRAIQSIQPPAGTQTLKLIPRAFGKSVHVIQTGTGSAGSSFPYFAPSCQLPVGKVPGPSYPEYKLDSPSQVLFLDTGTNTGYVTLPLWLPYSPNPGEMTLYRDAIDVVQDGDSRYFWPRCNNPATPFYPPTILTQEISYSLRHKVGYPVLCEIKEDFQSIGRAGTFVLVFFTQWYEFNTDNNIEMSSAPNDAAAAVFRLRGGFLNPRRVNA